MGEEYQEFSLTNVNNANRVEDDVEYLLGVIKHTYFTDEPDVTLRNAGDALMKVYDIRKALDKIENDVIVRTRQYSKV